MLLQVKEKDKRLECNALGADDLKKKSNYKCSRMYCSAPTVTRPPYSKQEETNIPNKHFSQQNYTV